ncbi:hypothetical protein DDB_G0283503 [Dictyostelium discoideum AX4]|uniref:Uncharacterized protein DDB_G0283503 n=1 Tax=Dictyostelium discoideum TaxID=44689 RepID=Y3503_DICDI|nr:hypothetical protein DDB_G0283503 [Dictyostelium discoideum AX4]Q54R36.1 RecName: Full=Uncharacterized protein DDB_G0283503 [Dictyostelium discoideum]EAL65736.1 hypothetical protein DDB_G0283503 [Dictyostelium discoideum AX4]|eukprot:XP_639055.1 hypothetical protein DDB_G0283503 [Dictyostelium discoideum AX4]
MLFKSLQSITSVNSIQKNQISSVSVGSSQSNNNAALLDAAALVVIPGLLTVAAVAHI